MTVIVAAIFMLTSLSLAILAKERNMASTVIDLNKKNESPAPAAPTQSSTESAPPGNTTPAGQ